MYCGTLLLQLLWQMYSRENLSATLSRLGSIIPKTPLNDGSSLATREAIDKFKETKATSKLGV